MIYTAKLAPKRLHQSIIPLVILETKEGWILLIFCENMFVYLLPKDIVIGMPIFWAKRIL